MRSRQSEAGPPHSKRPGPPAKAGLTAGLAAILIVTAYLALASAAAPPPSPGRVIGAVVPLSIAEIGQRSDGGRTYLAHGYAQAGIGTASLGGMASGDISFRLGGYCLDGSEVSLTPTGVSGNTIAWSYYVTGINVALVEDAPKGTCNYTVRVSYSLSITGAVTITQMEYSLYLRGHAKPGAPDSALLVIP
jgi:hypothetical protein